MSRRLLAALSVVAGIVIVTLMVARTGADLRGIWRMVPMRAQALALFANAAHFLLRGLRLALIARGIGVPLRTTTTTLSQLGSEAAGAVTPFRIGALPTKLLMLRRDGREVSQTAVALLGEVLADTAGLLVIVLVVLALLPDGRIAVLGALAYATIICALGAAAWWITGLPSGDDPPRLLRWLRVRGDRWLRLRTAALQFHERATVMRKMSPTLMAGVVGASVALIAVRIAVLPLLVYFVSGAEVAVAPLIAWPLTLLYLAPLLPPPSGGGVVELGFIGVLGPVLPADQLAGLTLWWRIHTYYLGATVGGVVIAMASHPRPRSAPRSRDETTDPM